MMSYLHQEKLEAQVRLTDHERNKDPEGLSSKLIS